MSREYRNRLPLLIHTEDGSYKQGQTFEKDFTEEDERTNVDSGLLEIVPRRYKVIGGSSVDGNEPGDEFTAALTIGREGLLVAGGHIELVEPKDKPKKKEK